MGRHVDLLTRVVVITEVTDAGCSHWFDHRDSGNHPRRLKGSIRITITPQCQKRDPSLPVARGAVGDGRAAASVGIAFQNKVGLGYF